MNELVEPTETRIFVSTEKGKGVPTRHSELKMVSTGIVPTKCRTNLISVKRLSLYEQKPLNHWVFSTDENLYRLRDRTTFEEWLVAKR